MRIAEIFYSIQGEGRLLGVPSVFIRTSGCNLRCVWCDTPYTSWKPEGEERSFKEIMAAAAKYPARHVVVTGGEPLLAPEIEELTKRLKQRAYHITIESAATIFKPVACDLMSMSPKLANSTPWKRENGKFAKMHEERRLNLTVMQKFIDRYDYQLKFVVDQRRDFDEIQRVLANVKHVDAARVLIMAQGRTKKELRERAPWIVALCKKHGFSYTPRLQIELWGNRRGT
ncbi:MAG: radical SAM protein [Deltaproteobacteria bacterium RIFCSPLOWO2_12_FULL_60_19]|nr:MAG: radical SAM protein [Deltaproteobacteria bacterium RIFCSPLOWO2_12_FULL_60_19]